MSPNVAPPTAPGDGTADPGPVLIAGAGPVGLCGALALARFGVASIILEEQPERDADYFQRTGSKAICFQRDVLDVFDRLGVAEPLLAEGTTWTTARTYFHEHEVRTVAFAHEAASEWALPPWINISQARVERELLRRAQAEQLIQIRFDHRLDGFQQEPDGVRAQASRPNGATASIRGSHLIGADGPRSAVRHLLGADFPGESYGDRFLICDIRAQLPFPNERRFYFDPEWNPGRQVLVHQCPDSTWRIDWQVPDGYDLEAERASGALERRIRRIVGERPYEIVWSSVYHFHERCADRFRDGRVFLAGDAAHLYAPFGARGLNSGVQDAENLAWKLAFARSGHVTGSGAEVLLDSYHDERWAAAQENLRVTGATMRFLVPHDEEQRRLRHDTLRRAVSDPAARERIDSGKLAEPYWYTESRLTTASAAAEAVPAEPGSARPPVPGVICPDGPCRVPARAGASRLRRLFGTGFTVLVAEAGRARSLERELADIGVPTVFYALAEIDPTGESAASLRCAGQTAHVVRPDAHLCAVVPADDTGAVRAAIGQAIGTPAMQTEESA